MYWKTYQRRSICLPNRVDICNCNSCRLSSTHIDLSGNDDRYTDRKKRLLRLSADSSGEKEGVRWGKKNNHQSTDDQFKRPPSSIYPNKKTKKTMSFVSIHYIALRLSGTVFDFALSIVFFQTACFGLHHFGGRVLRVRISASRYDSILFSSCLGVIG